MCTHFPPSTIVLFYSGGGCGSQQTLITQIPCPGTLGALVQHVVSSENLLLVLADGSLTRDSFVTQCMFRSSRVSSPFFSAQWPRAPSWISPQRLISPHPPSWPPVSCEREETSLPDYTSRASGTFSSVVLVCLCFFFPFSSPPPLFVLAAGCSDTVCFASGRPRRVSVIAIGVICTLSHVLCCGAKNVLASTQD